MPDAYVQTDTEPWLPMEKFANMLKFSGAGIGFMVDRLWINSNTYFSPNYAPDHKNVITVKDLSNAGHLLISQHNEDGSKSYLAGFPFQLEDNEFATGVDHASCSAAYIMHGYQDKIWIMAPQGTWKDGANVEHNNSNALVVKSALDSASLTWSCPHALFNGAAAEVALTGDATPIEISGTGATTVDDKLLLTMGSNIAISFPIGVKSMKRRTVKVIVYPVKRFPESTDPITSPKAEIEAELNRVFGKQVNAYFSVQIKERLIYDYDVLPTGVNQTSVADNALSNALEGHYLFDKCPKEDHDIIVAILNDGKIETGSDSTAGGHYVGSNDCVVVAENHTTIPRTRAQVLRTLSHEIGHVMIDVPE